MNELAPKQRQILDNVVEHATSLHALAHPYAHASSLREITPGFLSKPWNARRVTNQTSVFELPLPGLGVAATRVMPLPGRAQQEAYMRHITCGFFFDYIAQAVLKGDCRVPRNDSGRFS